MKLRLLPSALALALAGIVQPAAAAAAATPITVALVSRTLFNMPAWVAERKGFLRQDGYTFSLKLTQSAEDLNSNLQSGSYQLAISPPETIMVDSAQPGGRVQIVGGNAKKLPHFIIANPEIRSLAQLRGARIGVYSQNEGTTYLLADIAAAGGFAPGDYQVSVVGGAPARWQLLQAGKIDVALQPFPLSYEAEAAGYSNLGPLLAIVPDWQFTTINANTAWARGHREAVVAFLRALRQGQAYMESHPDEAAAIAAEELRSDLSLAKRALADAKRLGILDVDLSEPGLARVFRALQDAGQIERGRRFELRAFFNGEYLEASRN
jgi:ABC-type nitrate/sulfonate/bicarbonate transport system substrate-binding protein